RISFRSLRRRNPISDQCSNLDEYRKTRRHKGALRKRSARATPSLAALASFSAKPLCVSVFFISFESSTSPSKEVRVKSRLTRREFLQSGVAMFAGAAFPQGAATPHVTTVVGTGVRGTAADGDTADRADINNPFHIVLGPDGAMYFSDFGTSRVFRWDL